VINPIEMLNLGVRTAGALWKCELETDCDASQSGSLGYERPIESLSQPHLCQRGNRCFATYVWNDAQLEHSDRREIDMMILRLGA
jgi:hypothetical protein